MRVGRAGVVRAGRGRRGMDKATSAKPAGAPRAEDRWPRGRRQVANRSGAAQRGPKASPAPRAWLTVARRGRDLGKAERAGGRTPGPARLGFSPPAPLSLLAQPSAPDVTPAQGVGAARNRGGRD